MQWEHRSTVHGAFFGVRRAACASLRPLRCTVKLGCTVGTFCLGSTPVFSQYRRQEKDRHSPHHVFLTYNMFVFPVLGRYILKRVFARFLAIALPVQIKSLNSDVSPGTVPILTWAGIRGGVSVALALSLPSSSESELLLFVTYLVVLFSVAIQGLTIENVIKRYYP